MNLLFCFVWTDECNTEIKLDLICYNWSPFWLNFVQIWNNVDFEFKCTSLLVCELMLCYLRSRPEALSCESASVNLLFLQFSLSDTFALVNGLIVRYSAKLSTRMTLFHWRNLFSFCDWANIIWSSVWCSSFDASAVLLNLWSITWLDLNQLPFDWICSYDSFSWLFNFLLSTGPLFNFKIWCSPPVVSFHGASVLSFHGALKLMNCTCS